MGGCAAAMGRRGDIAIAARAAMMALVVARCCMPLARAAPVVDGEMEALESLAQEWKEAAGTSTWSRGRDCDSMDSLKCDGDGHVIALNIRGCSLVAPLPTALLALSHLKDLDFEFCNQLPRSLPDLPGKNPSPMGLSTASHGNLNASVPQELGNLQQLTRLSLSSNHLPESLPVGLSQLQKLQSLELSWNHQLSGELPAWIFSLTDLTSLDIKGNKFTGSIPEAISSLKQLRELRITEPTLLGSIPESIGALTNLEDLDFQGSRSLSGTIPACLGNLTGLTVLNLRKCGLSSSIPEAISSFKQLRELDLQANSLSGTIPAFIGNLTALLNLKLNDNAFSGSIPGTIGNLIQLSELDFEGNQFTGELPSFDHMGRLNIFPRSFSDLTATESRLPLNATGGDEPLQHRSLYTAVVEEALSVLQAPPNLLLLQLLPLAVLLQLALALSLAILRRLKNRPPTRYFFSRRALAARQAAMDVEIT